MKPSRTPQTGHDIPAEIGMVAAQVGTPSLVIDLEAFEHNVRVMGEFLGHTGVRLRAHAKTHKSVDISHYQINHGGACGMCCQKVSEAETLVAGGITDILVSNQVTDPAKIDRLARLAAKARIIVCVDDLGNVDELNAAATLRGAILECLVEIECGAGRCGVQSPQQALQIAQAIDDAPALEFSGIQAYQGSAQHIREYADRGLAIENAVGRTRETLDVLNSAGFSCDIVGGAGTGSYPFEAASGVYNELQCGSYIFMDRDYGEIKNAAGNTVSEFKNSLFVLTSVMSTARPGYAVCDAGHKSHSIDSGLPAIFGRSDLSYVEASDEHGVLSDPENSLALNDRLYLVPGHCDPTCNLHDWYVGLRNGRVECLWPVNARGKLL